MPIHLYLRDCHVVQWTLWEAQSHPSWHLIGQGELLTGYLVHHMRYLAPLTKGNDDRVVVVVRGCWTAQVSSILAITLVPKFFP